MISEERKKYLKRIKKEKLIITFSQISILIIFFAIWELLSKLNIIDTKQSIYTYFYYIRRNNNKFYIR